MLRFVIASIILAANTALFGLGRAPVYFLIILAYILTILYTILLSANISNAFYLYSQIITDLIIETLLIHYTGGIDSVLNLLYPLSSISASILITGRAGVFIALLGSILYTIIVSLEFLNIFPLPEKALFFLTHDSSYVFSLLYFRVTIFCIIGFLSAYIAEQLKKKNKEVMSLEAKLRREDRLSAIGKLAANAAHEIRNPLASISGCVEALKESLKLDSENEKLFNLIIKETSRLNNIINRLLEYVKPKKLQLEKVNMQDLIEEVITLVKNNKDFKTGVLIKMEGEFNQLKVVCDPQQIKQVFFNLLINAVEAVNDKGKIIISGRANKTKNNIQIDVIDNGRGMDKERLASLFEPFSSSKEKGVGLGLAIAYSIIKEHGGNMEVVSKHNHGSTFSIYLPIKIKRNEG